MKKFTKNLLAIVSIFTLFSCTHQDQKIKLDFSFDEKNLIIQNPATLEVVVLDARSEKAIIGKKKFGDEEIKITTEQNLVEFLQKKISQNLADNGFKKGTERIVEIHIENLEYKTKRKFFIATSKAKATLKVVVKNDKSGKKFMKNFDLSLKNKHFVVPLASTDEQSINALLQELVANILSDKSFLNSLQN